MTEGITFWNAAGALWTNGWRGLIPIVPGDKRPIGSNWQRFADGGQTRDDLRRLALHAGHGAGIGMVGGNGCTIIDIDVLVPETSEFVRGVVEEELGATPLHVVGKAPKRKMLYRGGVRGGKQANPGGLALEIFHGLPSDKNGQCVLYGQHPDTNQPYNWPFESPLTMRLEDAPEISADGLERVLDRLTPLVNRRLGLAACTGMRDVTVHGGVSADIIRTMARGMARASNGEGISTAVELLGDLLPGSRHNGLVVVVRILIAEWMIPPLSVFEGLADTWLALAGPERFDELEQAIKWSMATRPPETSVTIIGGAKPIAASSTTTITTTTNFVNTGKAPPRRRRLYR
jgi:hypothetical protein